MLDIIELITDLGSTIMVIGFAGAILTGVPYLMLRDNTEEPSTVIKNLKTGIEFSTWCGIVGGVIIVLGMVIFIIAHIWK
jgi:hypothetical protein